MKRYLKIALVISVIVVLSACTLEGQYARYERKIGREIVSPNTSYAALEALQSRDYTIDKAHAMNVALLVLQDFNYRIDVVDYDSGIITAYSGPNMRNRAYDNTEITVSVSSHSNNESTVRVVLVDNSLKFKGDIGDSHPFRLELADSRLYQIFFNQFENNQFSQFSEDVIS